MNKEDKIVEQIENVNALLNIICKELNKLETIDDYEIELNETEYTSYGDKKHQKNYKIMVTTKTNLK